MNRFKIYLAGPIAGLSIEDAEDWRADFRALMAPRGIDCYSPLRQKDFLKGAGVIEDDMVQTFANPMSCDRGIMTRDHWDCQTSDLIVCNLLGAARVTIGSCMEMAWAFAYRKPLIVAIETNGNIHDHPMIREAISFRVDTLHKAAAIAQAILLPETNL